jgi:pyruvate oxidase
MQTTLTKMMEQKTNGPHVSHYTVSEYIIEQLSSWGVQRIYGVIGDANLYFLDALAGQNKLKYIACKHESAAAMMASAEAKLTGNICVCMATSGPGLANLINGLGDAAMDLSGVLAITGQVETSKIGTQSKQFIEQQRLMSGLTEHSHLLAGPKALPEMLQQLLVTTKTSGKLSHLSIPKDMYLEKLEGQVYPYQNYLQQEIEAPYTIVEEAIDRIKQAERPVILIGRGVKRLSEAVQSFAEQLGAAVITTMPARPLFPNDHALYSGGLGQAGSEASTVLLQESDLILIMGATWWPDDYVPNQASIIQIDKRAANIGMGLQVEMGIVADLASILPKLISGVPKDHYLYRASWMERIKQANTAWKEQITRETNMMNQAPVSPQRLIKIISELAKENSVLTLDTGDHTVWFNRIFQAKPKQDILLSGRWRTLGFGIPAAIAAKLAYPERQVIAVVGDGGVIQTLMEFQTAVDQGAPITVVIVNNGSYAMEKNRMKVSGLSTLGSELNNPDFAKIAEACGGLGFTAIDAEALQNCLQAALGSKQPAIVDVKVQDTIIPHTKI